MTVSPPRSLAATIVFGMAVRKKLPSFGFKRLASRLPFLTKSGGDGLSSRWLVVGGLHRGGPFVKPVGAFRVGLASLAPPYELQQPWETQHEPP